jgi:hypothetical protein
VDSLSCGVTNLPCCISDSSGSLIEDTFTRKVIIACYSSDALLDVTHNTVPASGQTCFTAPLPNSFRSVLETVNASLVLQGGLEVKQGYRGPDCNTRKNPMNRLHTDLDLVFI